MANHKFWVPGVLLAGTMLVASCAPLPFTAGDAGKPAVSAAAKTPGEVTVPLNLPAMGDRSVQYLYDSMFINTVEVTLTDSWGNEQEFYVLRNPGASGASGGQANLTFRNVMPGEFVVTVRTSHKRLLGNTSEGQVISYDPDADAYYYHYSANSLFNPYEQAVTVSGSPTSPVIVLQRGEVSSSTIQGLVFPAPDLWDASDVKRAYGVGGATGVLQPGATAPISVQVGQMPRFAGAVAPQTVDAGQDVTLEVADGAHVQAGDKVVISSSSFPAQTSMINLSSPNLEVLPLTKNEDEISFTPQKPVNNGYVYLVRGESISMIGVSGTNPPRVTVNPKN